MDREEEGGMREMERERGKVGVFGEDISLGTRRFDFLI